MDPSNSFNNNKRERPTVDSSLVPSAQILNELAAGPPPLTQGGTKRKREDSSAPTPLATEAGPAYTRNQAFPENYSTELPDAELLSQSSEFRRPMNSLNASYGFALRDSTDNFGRFDHSGSNISNNNSNASPPLPSPLPSSMGHLSHFPSHSHSYSPYQSHLPYSPNFHSFSVSPSPTLSSPPGVQGRAFPGVVSPMVIRSDHGAPSNNSNNNVNSTTTYNSSPTPSSTPSPSPSSTTSSSSSSSSAYPTSSAAVPPPPPPPTEAREDDDEEENTYKIPSLADQPYDENDDRPSKRIHLSADSTPLDKLMSNQYLYLLRQLESKLKTVRANILQRELNGLGAELKELRNQISQYGEEFETLKTKHYLRAGDFNNLLSLEEFLMTTLSPQLNLYELDFDQLTSANTNNTTPEIPVFLSIVNQETAGPIFKEKSIGPFTLRLLTGATITQIQSGPVQPKLVDTSQRIKRNNQELENAKQNFKENGTATFTDLKFSSGTFPNLVRLKFRVTIQIMVNNQKMTKTIESAPTKPFVSMTNTGSQWKDAAGTWLKEELFQVDTYEVSMARLWNYFQKHYLISTKQELSNIKRPLSKQDFEYLLKCRFKQGIEKNTINQKEFTTFWDWIGPALKKIRYQKYLLWLFENGYLCAFVTAKEAEEQLQNETPGTFLIRLSERLDGELVISYTHGLGIRHYLVQGDDTADKKKTLIDFLGQNKIFIYLLQITTQANGKRIFYKHQKDKVLSKYYKKQQKQSSVMQPLDTNPYDTRLPVDLHSLGL